MLPGQVGLGKPGKLATVTYVGATGDSSGASTYTFTNHAIGVAAFDRLVVVAVHWENTTSLTSITIGGNAATIIAQNVGGASNSGCALAMLLVPAGTTATIVVNLAGAALRCGVGVWNVNGYGNATPTSNSNASSGAATSIAQSVAVKAQGVAIAALTINDPNAIGWTNATERYDANIGGGNTRNSGADFTETGPDETRTFTAAYSSQTGAAIVVASWR